MKKYITILALFALCISLSSCSGITAKDNAPEESVTKEKNEYTSDYVLDKSKNKNTLEYNEQNVFVTFTKINFDDGVTKIAYNVKNKNDFGVTVMSDDMSVNGFMCKDSLSIAVDKNDSVNGTVSIGNDWFESMGIKRITDFELSLVLLDQNSQIIAKSGLLSMKTDALGEYVQKYDTTSGNSLYNENGIKIMSRDIKKSEYSKDSELEIYVENNTKQTITIVATDVKVNGKEITATYVSTLNSGKKSENTFLLYEKVLKNAQIDSITSINANFKAYNENYEIVLETGVLNIPLNNEK